MEDEKSNPDFSPAVNKAMERFHKRLEEVKKEAEKKSSRKHQPFEYDPKDGL